MARELQLSQLCGFVFDSTVAREDVWQLPADRTPTLSSICTNGLKCQELGSVKKKNQSMKKPLVTIRDVKDKSTMVQLMLKN